MTLAMLTIPCADGIGKYLSAEHSPLFLGWARYAAAGVFIVPATFVAGKGDRIPRQQVPLQLLRAVFLVGSVSLYYLAIARIPLADALGAYLAQSPHRSKNGQLAERMTNMLQNSVAMGSRWATA